MLYVRHITRQMIRESPDALFVFGDNLSRTGYGGQAKECRGEPNAVGIPTKHRPSMEETAFFTDADIDLVMPALVEAVARLTEHAWRGGKIVWPKDGIGTGLAQLPHRAPLIWDKIENLRTALDAIKLANDGEFS